MVVAFLPSLCHRCSLTIPLSRLQRGASQLARRRTYFPPSNHRSTLFWLSANRVLLGTKQSSHWYMTEAQALFPDGQTMESKSSIVPRFRNLPSLSSFDRYFAFFAIKVPASLTNQYKDRLSDHVLSASKIPCVHKVEGSEDQQVRLLLLKYLMIEVSNSKPGVVLGELPQKRQREEERPRDIEEVNWVDLDLPEALGNSSTEFISANRAESKQAVVDLISTVLTDHSTKPLDFRPEMMTTFVQSTGFHYWSPETIFKALIPTEITIPTSHEQVGHLIHLNLKEQHEPVKFLIGQVLYNKLKPRVRTVVNKLANLSGQFRTFHMELLAGDEDYECEVKENGCTFHLDFRKVYWNSRLEGEHNRIARSLTKDSILADAFGGVGPFVIPGAKWIQQRKNKAKEEQKKKGIKAGEPANEPVQILAYGNDLNPSSVEYMRKNVALNKVDKLIKTSCKCAREFIKDLIACNISFTHVPMNFPAGAPEFLDMFRGSYMRDGQRLALPLPTIYCYCFAREEFMDWQPLARVARALYGIQASAAPYPRPEKPIKDPKHGESLDAGEDDDTEDPPIQAVRDLTWPLMDDKEIVESTGISKYAKLRYVRTVSPQKIHVCVEISLPEDVAYASI